MNKIANSILRPALRAAAAVDPSISERVDVALRVLNGREQKADEKPSGLLSQAEVARRLGCSRWTVRNLCADGVLQSVQLRTARKYRRVDVQRIIAEGTK